MTKSKKVNFHFGLPLNQNIDLDNCFTLFLKFASILIQTKPSPKHTTFGEVKKTVHCNKAENLHSQEFVRKVSENQSLD